MDWSIRTFIEAREAVAQVLNDLHLQNYRFDVEPRDAGWEVHLEYAAGAVWTETKLGVDQRSLENALRDDASRRELVARWKEQLKGVAERP